MDGLADPQWYGAHPLDAALPTRFDGPAPGPAARWRQWWQAQVLDSEPVRTAARQGFVLGTAQLRDLGVSRATARAALRRRSWFAPAYGVVAPIDVRGSAGDSTFTLERRRHALVAAAAAQRRSRSVVGARSAAVLHGLPTLRVPTLAELTTPEDAGLGSSSVHNFGAALAARSVTSWFGVPVTDVARTVVDLARHDRRDGLMAVDAALREDLVDRRQLDAALRDAVGWPGVRQARAIVDLASPLAESPLESLTRLALHDSGFPAPQLQVDIGAYRVDLLLADQRLVIEADGRIKYDADELWREKRREHDLRNAGFAVERVIWADVTSNWPATEQRLRRRLHPPSPFRWS